eukprot:366331-Chlamydomonas_euryale.AAC.18
MRNHVRIESSLACKDACISTRTGALQEHMLCAHRLHTDSIVSGLLICAIALHRTSMPIHMPMPRPEPLNPFWSRDPRISGPMMEAALVSGIASTGAHVDTFGIATTPCMFYSIVATGVGG